MAKVINLKKIADTAETEQEITEIPVEQRCLESPKYTCALGGALAVIVNIKKAIPIIHAGIGCGMSQLLSFRYGGGAQGVDYVSGLNTPSSNLSEKEIVFGGEERLKKQIRSTIDLIDGDLYMVANGCIAGMIGDDVGAVVSEFASETAPVLYVNSSGFMGNTYYGYEAALEAIVNQLLAPQPKIKGLVNILGFVPYQNVFWRGDLRRIKSLLKKIGIKTNQIVGDASGLEGLKRLSSAELTVVVSPWVGVKTARLLEEKFDIPYVTYPNIPVGPRDASEFLRLVGSKLKISERKIERIIKEGEAEAYQDLNIAGDTVAQFANALPLAIISNSATAVGITRFLTNEASFTPTLVIINDDPPLEVRQEIVERLTNLGHGISPRIVFEIDFYEIDQHLKNTYYRVLLASSQEKYQAEAAGQIHLSITFPTSSRLIVRDTYSGYGGGISLLEDILSKFIRP